MDYSIEARRYLKDDPRYVITGCTVCAREGREPQALYFTSEANHYGCTHCGEHPWAFFTPPGWVRGADRG
jgi:hypothetical protein